MCIELSLIDALNKIRTDVLLRKQPSNSLNGSHPLYDDIEQIRYLASARQKTGLSIERPVELLSGQLYWIFQRNKKMELFVYATLVRYSFVFLLIFFARISLYWVTNRDLDSLLKGYGVFLGLLSYGLSFFL